MKALFASLVVAMLMALGPGAHACDPTCTFDADIASGWDKGFARSRRQNFAPHGLAIVAAKDGHPVRGGQSALRFEVRGGDCGWDDARSGARSDCATDRERHEISQRGFTPDGTWWFGWSLYFPADHPNVFPTKAAVGQFHQRGGRVIWMFQNHDGGYWVDNQSGGGTLERKMIVTDVAMRGRWTDIAVHAKWSAGQDGFFRVYVNGAQEPAYSWTGPTTEGHPVYFKIGIYRSFVSRWRKATGLNILPTQVVYVDEIRRGPVRGDVTPRP